VAAPKSPFFHSSRASWKAHSAFSRRAPNGVSPPLPPLLLDEDEDEEDEEERAGRRRCRSSLTMARRW